MNTDRKDSVESCILKVDFGYSEELYNVHNDYPHTTE